MAYAFAMAFCAYVRGHTNDLAAVAKASKCLPRSSCVTRLGRSLAVVARES
jgi:hypothetical protein